MASYTKQIGYGCTFGVDFTGGTTYVVLGHVVNIKGGGAKTNFANTSLLADKFDTYLPASTEPGTFKFSIGYDPLDTGTGAVYGALAAAQKNGTLLGCNITSPTGAEPFQAYVENVERVFDKKALSMLDIELQITGSPGMAGN